MPFMIVRHRVRDFTQWKRVFDSHQPARQAMGIQIVHVLRNADSPNDLTILCRSQDEPTLRALSADSPEEQEILKQATIVGKPRVEFLNEA